MPKSSQSVNHKLLGKYPVITDQISKASLTVLLDQLETVLRSSIAGDIVELGCYEGTSALFIQRVLREYRHQNRQLYLYDSFEGLPTKHPLDESATGTQFKKTELKTTKQKLINNFKHASLNVPIIKKAWFNDLAPEDMPDIIAFAFLDGDFYESILSSLNLVWPRLSSGGIIVVDDYRRSALPGVEKAIQTFFTNYMPGITQKGNLAIINKN